jgi:hypothetical protein
MKNTTLEDENVATVTNALDSEADELEAKVAPGISVNHNETPVEDSTSDDSVLEIEELEMKIAPGRGVNHNETFVSDIAG